MMTRKTHIQKREKLWRLVALAAGAVILFSHCAPKPVTVTEPSLLRRLARSEYPRFQDQSDYIGLSDSIEMSLVYLRRLPAQQTIHFGADAYTVSEVIVSLLAFAAIVQERPPPETLNRLIAERFRVYQAVGDPSSGQVLYTGYYEPLLQGSLQRSLDFAVPLYSRPADLVEIDLSLFGDDLKGRRIVGRYTGRTVVPYQRRDEIRRQADFQNQAPVLAWLRDEFDLLNLQTQGSGKIVLPDGSVMQVSYDGSNGHPYRSIGQMLITEGRISREHLSMQAIRSYLREHGDQSQQILDHNPRYIFFRRVAQGPVGALGVRLTAGRSIAVDRSVFPLAALVFVETDIPLVVEVDAVAGRTAFSGFALAQDTGSAITGPGRVDFFWGSGLRAELLAGHMKYAGRLFFLMLDPETSQS